eukprot:COSAG05_NODE_6529_length_943_cov_0.727488_1_plen_139_part_10
MQPTLLALAFAAPAGAALAATLQSDADSTHPYRHLGLAPIVGLEGNASRRQGSFVPVVFLHGMGDSGKNSGMKSLCKTASDKYPGMHSVCSNVANGMSSITTELHKQVQEFAAEVRADPKLAQGFTAVGLSQGNLVLRG